MDTILRAQDGQTFGRMLRGERKALGKSQAEVAAAVGTRRQTIADLENGKNVGSHIVFAVLAAIGKMVAITDARPDLETIRACWRPAMADDSLRGKVKALEVSTPQGASGRLLRESQYVFNYQTQARNCEIALGMPLRAASYISSQPHPIFAMNLPEGNLRQKIRERYGKQFAKLDDMAMRVSCHT